MRKTKHFISWTLTGVLTAVASVGIVALTAKNPLTNTAVSTSVASPSTAKVSVASTAVTTSSPFVFTTVTHGDD